jgi:hypothetical protein
MSEAGTGSVKSGLGLWPKLVLWTLVLVFGVLYLGSVKRNAPVQSPTPVAAAPTVPVPGVSPPPGDAGPQAAAHQAPAETRDAPAAEDQARQGQAPVSDPESVRAAESAAFVDSLMTKEHGDTGPGEPGGAPDREAESSGAGGADGSPPSPEGGTAGQGTGVVAPPTSAQPSESTPATEGPRAASAAPDPSGSSSPDSLRAPGASAPGEGVEVRDRSREAEESERARILKEYEVMRRAAEEQMRQYWQQIGVPGPPRAPYGQPGFGYGPGVYPPR